MLSHLWRAKKFQKGAETASARCHDRPSKEENLERKRDVAGELREATIKDHMTHSGEVRGPVLLTDNAVCAARKIMVPANSKPSQCGRRDIDEVVEKLKRNHIQDRTYLSRRTETAAVAEVATRAADAEQWE